MARPMYRLTVVKDLNSVRTAEEIIKVSTFKRCQDEMYCIIGKLLCEDEINGHKWILQMATKNKDGEYDSYTLTRWNADPMYVDEIFLNISGVID